MLLDDRLFIEYFISLSQNHPENCIVTTKYENIATGKYSGMYPATLFSKCSNTFPQIPSPLPHAVPEDNLTLGATNRRPYSPPHLLD